MPATRSGSGTPRHLDSRTSGAPSHTTRSAAVTYDPISGLCRAAARIERFTVAMRRASRPVQRSRAQATPPAISTASNRMPSSSTFEFISHDPCMYLLPKRAGLILDAMVPELKVEDTPEAHPAGIVAERRVAHRVASHSRLIEEPGSRHLAAPKEPPALT